MKHRHFRKAIDEQQIVQAIRNAETRTSGQVRVFVSRYHVGDALAAARRQFDRLGMSATRQHNAVLIFVAPQSQQFAVYGDTAIHQRCGTLFWDALRDQMAGFFKTGQYTAGLIHAIDKSGEMLGLHFPPDRVPLNELADKVEHD